MTIRPCSEVSLGAPEPLRLFDGAAEMFARRRYLAVVGPEVGWRSQSRAQPQASE